MSVSELAAGRPRLRRPTGDASRSVSAAFLRVEALGDRRIVTAASLRDVGALRVAAEGLAATFLREPAFSALPVLAVLTGFGLRAATAGLAVRVLRAVVVLAVLRPAVAVLPRVAGVVRAAPRLAVLVFGAVGFAVRVGARVVDFAAVARVRDAGAAAAVLRAGD